MRLRTLMISICLVAAALPGSLYAAARSWEPVRVERQDVKVVARDSEVEIKAAPGIIQVTSNHPVQIKIFTILGRLVNSETLPQGSMQFLVPAHGVYIVQVGDVTCKVAV